MTRAQHAKTPIRPVDRVLLTPAEASAHIRLSERTLRRYAAIGKLPAYRIGGLLRYAKSDLDAVIDAALI